MATIRATGITNAANVVLKFPKNDFMFFIVAIFKF
jgi:hypothetical protein